MAKIKKIILKLKKTRSAVVFLLSCFFILVGVSFIFIEPKLDYSMYTATGSIRIEDRIKQIAEYCGEGYAVGWWRAEEDSLEYRNIALYRNVCSNNKCITVSAKDYNIYYQKTHKFIFPQLSYFRQQAILDKPVICKNIKRCEGTRQPVLMELLTKSKLANDNKDYNLSETNLREVFEKTHIPVLDLIYYITGDKHTERRGEIYNLFHISVLSPNVEKCDYQKSAKMLSELVRGLN